MPRPPGTRAPPSSAHPPCWTPPDAALEAYEAEIRALRPASDAQLLAAVERVVLALNGIDEEHGAYCTIEREELCEYIDGVLTGHGVDVAALAARNGKDADDIAGEWRDW
ncbi:hypothetical protein [Streptomyces sp. NPDC002187]|uniref:hypothetical protein n=1 Tax=Streptomyces sp. NPDC002187 TaxID=3364637 RepID=UPI00369C7598